MTSSRRSGVCPVPGTALAWETVGEGPAVIFLHGFSVDHRMWDDQVDAFAREHTVVRYDLRGFGRSPAAHVPYRHSEDLAALLDHLEIASPAVVGLSMGGGVALSFACLFPERARAVVAVDTALGGFRWSPMFEEELAVVANVAKVDGTDAAKRQWLKSPLMAGALALPEAGRRLRTMIQEYSGWHWLNADPAQPLVPSTRERLPQLRTPILALVGELDGPDFHRVAEIVEREAADARRVVLPNVGHLPNLEDPARFNEVVLDFLDGAAR